MRAGYSFGCLSTARFYARCSVSRQPALPRLAVRRRCRSNQATGSDDQAKPLDGDYAALLDKPLGETQLATKTALKPPPADGLPKTEAEERLAKARVVFGSRLAGPAERRDEINRESILLAGVLVPPRPDEPDNCCMSGCVNCVWERYGDELEEWAAKSAEARIKIHTKRAAGKTSGLLSQKSGISTHVAVSMDDDGGGNETNWSAGEDGPVDLFGDIPIGIREFMKTEKRLKQRHIEQQTLRG